MNIAHENLKRALMDEAPFATRQWWCAFGIHTWLIWDQPQKNRRAAYDYIEQYRRCGCCGKVQRKQIAKD